MKQALYQFTKDSLASASRGLLNKLGIKYQKSSDTPMPKDAILNKLNASQSIREAFEIITKIYFIGLVDDRTFNNISDSIDYDSAIRDAEGDKYNGMLCFACEINDDAKVKRTTYAIITRAFNKLANNKPVVLITLQRDKLGISTCERIDKKRDAGEKMGKVNLLQNINCTEPHTGHIRILESLQVGTQINTFDALYKHWFDAFNTKTLTDRFYKELYNWYMWVVNDPNTHFPENSHLPEHENEKKNVKIIRLITRLLFVWFIKEKKVKRGEGLPDIGLVPSILFDTKELEKVLNDFDPNSETDGEYYNAILQNLFFATLNNEVKSRKFIDTSNFYRSKKGYTVKNLYRDNKGEGKSWFKISHDEVINLFKTVPFLNCGLFECLDKYKRTDISYDVDRFFDGFSTKSGDKYRACLPNRLFFASELPEITIEVTEKGKKVPIKIKSKGLINLLNEYVFTVEENTPLEQQVSLDPELLGKVFENLLAAYNPETEESARKSSGSYYTPREIVEYMVNESLIQYLKTKLDADDETETQLRNLVSPSNLDFNFSDNQQDGILEALYHCRILDPACGSGAFPMGMLQQMVHIISRLDEHNEKWEKLITQKATDETTKAFENKELTDEERKAVIAEITNTFTNNKNNPDYTRKLYLIQNCIFGVDIQPIAMMISKLRFFISLICEQDENAINFNDKDNNFGIHTLPNLETKFVAANSLLTPDVRKFTGDWTNDKQLDKLKDELMELRYRHVTARSMRDKMKIRTLDDEKRQEINEYILSTQAHADPAKIAMCQDQIAHLMIERKLYEGENIVEEYVDTQADLFADTTRELVRKDVNRAKRDEIDRQIHICQAQIECEKAKENISGFAAAVKQLTEWNPYDQVKSSPFFDPDWMFGITEGFDIIIGNPPYVEAKKLKSQSADLKNNFEVYSGTADLSIYFVELAIRNLNEHGKLCYITTNKFFNTTYGKLLRKMILDHTITHLINFEQVEVFKDVLVSSVILGLMPNSVNNNHFVFHQFIKLNNEQFKTEFLTKQDDFGTYEQSQLNESEWSFAVGANAELKRKLDLFPSIKTTTGLQVHRGVTTGYNPAFIISNKQRDELIKRDPNNAKIIKNMLQGRNIRKWYYNESDENLIFTKQGLNIEIYPYVKDYLYHFYNQLKPRESNGEKEGRKPGNYKWFEIQDNTAYYLEFEKKEKIIWGLTADKWAFTLDKGQHYLPSNGYILTSETIPIRFLLGLLNSKLLQHYFGYIGVMTAGGAFTLKDTTIQAMPLAPATDLQQKAIIDLVDDILSKKELSVNSDISKLEEEIDHRVYALYGLTYDEVLIVDKNFKLSKEAYEKLLAEK